MGRLVTVVFALAVAGCATTGKGGPAPVASLPMCMPCPNPCYPIPACDGRVAAPAPAPAPAPAQAPAPAPTAPSPAAAATFSPAPGNYPAPQSVTLSSATPGAVIHCTTDGTEPTAASPVCAGPVPVHASTTIRAIALAPGLPASEASAGTYAIAPPPPSAPPARVVVTKEKLELRDKVFFDTGKSTIKAESFPLLDEVAQVMKDHPEVRHVIIEGHTDNLGKAAANLKLSQGRAAAVRTYLVGKGVAADRLAAKGFGAARPVADNKTAKGREENRRVEFVVVH